MEKELGNMCIKDLLNRHFKLAMSLDSIECGKIGLEIISRIEELEENQIEPQKGLGHLLKKYKYASKSSNITLHQELKRYSVVYEGQMEF